MKDRDWRVIPTRVSELLATTVLCLLLSHAATAQVISDTLAELKDVGIVEHLGEQVPLDLRFRNHTGDEVVFGDYFNAGLPSILVMHYSDCPMLCSMVLTSLSNTLRELAFVPGKSFNILTVSIDSDESTERCSQTQQRYAGYLKAGATPDAWTFFTGEQTSISSLTNAIGFNYNFVQKTGEFAHTAAIFVLTETGSISRYLYGIDFKERNLRLALVEASEGKIGTTVDRILLYCFQYDPDANGYVAVASQIMKLGGLVTVAGLIILISTLRLKKTGSGISQQADTTRVNMHNDV